MDQEEMRTTSDEMAWPELAADLKVARAAARSVTLDTHRASEDGRILEATAQLELMRTRLASLERHVFDAPLGSGLPDDLAERLNRLDQEMSSTSSHLSDLALRVVATENTAATSLLTSVDGFDSRLTAIEDARRAQAGEVNDLTGYLEQAFVRITELAALIEDERGSNAASRAESFNKLGDYRSDVETTVTQLDQAVAELTARVDQASNTIDEANSDAIGALDLRVDRLESQLEQSIASGGGSDETATSIQFLTSRAEALERAQVNTANHIVEHVDNAHSRLDSAEERLSTSETRHDATRIRIDSTDNRLDDLTSRVDSASSQEDSAGTGEIEALSSEIAEVKAAGANHSSVLETHSDILDAATNLLSDQATALNENDQAIAQHSKQMADHERLVQEALAAASEANEAAQHASDRVNTIVDTNDLMSQRIDLVDSATEDLRGRVEVSNATAAEAASTAATARDSVEQLTERVANTEAHLDGAIARFDELGEQRVAALADIDTSASANEVRDELSGQIHNTNARIDEAHGRVDAAQSQIEERASELGEQINAVDARFSQTENQIDGVHHRVNDVVAQVDALDAQIAEIAQVDQANSSAPDTEMVDGLSGRIDEAHGAIEQASSTASEAKTKVGEIQERVDQFDSRIDATDERIEWLRSEFGNQINSIEALESRFTDTEGRLAQQDDQSSDSGEEIRLELLGRIDDAESRFNERLAEVEGDPEDRLSNLHASVSQAEESARKAHELGEGLRVLQAELVQTLQTEMHAHSVELEQHAATLAELSGDEEYAPAERVHQLENKIVEALQTISQLTQLQRRNTAVETQLTDTLTATSEGVEHTQRHVIALRTELEKALSRIAHLESTTGASAPADTTPAAAADLPPAAVQQPAPAPEPAQAVGDSTTAQAVATAPVEASAADADDDDANTDWFNESYARKNS